MLFGLLLKLLASMKKYDFGNDRRRHRYIHCQILRCSCWFCNPALSFDAVYCFICSISDDLSCSRYHPMTVYIHCVQVCTPTTMTVGDVLDNDCDGLIDEELCTNANGGAGLLTKLLHFRHILQSHIVHQTIWKKLGFSALNYSNQ